MASTISAGLTTTTALVYTADTSGVLQLQTNGTNTAVTIDTSQRVGIGTSSPSYLLSLNTTSNNPSLYINSNQTASDFITFTNGTYTGTLGINGNSGNLGAYLLSNGTLRFATNNAEVMRLDLNGNLLVNQTSQTNNGKMCLTFNGNTFNGLNMYTTYSSTGSQYLSFYNSGGTQIGYILQNASTTVNYSTSSDSRLKNLIGVATDTSVIDNIVVNDYIWKVDGTADRGVFAQDAIKIKPSAVSQGKDDTLDENGLPIHPWGVDYSKFVPDLIVHAQQLKKTVQELSAQVTALQAKVGE